MPETNIIHRGRISLHSRLFLGTNPDRHLVILHGAGEHSGRYQRVAHKANLQGWNVVLFDLSGHGASAGPRCDIEHFSEYIDDLEAVVEAYKIPLEHCMLLAHSTGGLVATRWLQTRQPPVAGLVLSAPLLGLGVPVPPHKLWLGKLMAKTFPRFRFRNEIKSAQLTSDMKILDARRKDPMILSTITTRWFFAVQDAIKAAHDEAERLTTPFLIVQGLADQIVDVDAMRAWVPKTGSRDREVLELPDRLHEVLNEIDWEKTLAHIFKWMDAHAPSESLETA